MNYRRDEVIFRIIFLTAGFTLIVNMIYYGIYQTAHQECELLAAGDTFTYNTFDGCIIDGVKQWKVIMNYQH